MNSKKNIITIVVVVIIIIVIAFLWKGGFRGTKTIPTGETNPTSQSGTVGETGDQATKQTGSIGKMTDEIYVEIMSQVAYNGTKDPVTWAQNGFPKLLAKYGITEENYAAYGQELSKDMTRATAVAQKYSQRLTELQKTGQ